MVLVLYAAAVVGILITFTVVLLRFHAGRSWLVLVWFWGKTAVLVLYSSVI